MCADSFFFRGTDSIGKFVLRSVSADTDCNNGLHDLTSLPRRSVAASGLLAQSGSSPGGSASSLTDHNARAMRSRDPDAAASAAARAAQLTAAHRADNAAHNAAAAAAADNAAAHRAASAAAAARADDADLSLPSSQPRAHDRNDGSE